MSKFKFIFPSLTLVILFQFFSASAQSTNADAPVFLFSTFDGDKQDGLRFAYSFDGYHWTNVPGLFLRPWVGSKIMRDPSITRGPDGTFHLVWTSAWKGDKGF